MKTIPSTLQAHKDKPDTTLAHLVKITPVVGVTPASVFGITSNSADIVYDDGTGALTYHASNGADLSNLSASLDLGVDNAEIVSLLSEFDVGTITEADVLSGKLDYAKFVTYSVNWANLSDGHEIVQVGTLGEATTIDGLSVTLETRSLSQQLKRPIVEGDSITCRAVFGSMAGDPGIRFPCNFDTTAEWINVTVTSVGVEPDLQFAVSGLAVADGFLVPGIVQWFTGANAGRTHEIESQIGSSIELVHPSNFDIAIGDTGRIRRDCAKRYVEDCINRFNNRPNFRGEPLIPQGEEGSTQVSGSASAAPANPQPTPSPVIPVGNPVVIANLDFESGNTGWSMSPGAPGVFSIVNDGAIADSGAWFGRYVGSPGGMAAVNLLTDGVLVLPGSPITVDGRVRILSTSAGQTSVTIRVIITSVGASSEFADVNSIISTFKFSSAIDGTLPWTDFDTVRFTAATSFPSPIWVRIGAVIQNPVGAVDVAIDNFAITATGP